MAEEQTLFEWRVIGETVPGASHLRAGIPNQDSLLFARESSRHLPIVISAADGHGSAKCFRSDRGSQFAVKKAAFLISEFLDERRGNFDLSEIESNRDYLALELVRRWREAVEADLEKNPFTEKEFEILEQKSGADSKKLIDENPFLAYGTTSLTVAIEEDFALYIQLGDGDILNVSPTGEVIKPLSEDPRLLANETTSMCLPKAEQDFRFLIQKFSDVETPAMILISTDGYLNSFSSEAGFFQAGSDILQMLATETGFNDVNDNLKSWLEEATQMGSGDDCTVAIVYRPDLLKKAETNDQTITVAENLTTTETPPSKETSEAIAALTDSKAVSPEDLEDVTVTITIKKDKNKLSKSPPEVKKPEPESTKMEDSVEKINAENKSY